MNSTVGLSSAGVKIFCDKVTMACRSECLKLRGRMLSGSEDLRLSTCRNKDKIRYRRVLKKYYSSYVVLNGLNVNLLQIQWNKNAHESYYGL